MRKWILLLMITKCFKVIGNYTEVILVNKWWNDKKNFSLNDKGKVYPLCIIPIINLNLFYTGLLMYTFITTICCIINIWIAIHFSIRFAISLHIAEGYKHSKKNTNKYKCKSISLKAPFSISTKSNDTLPLNNDINTSGHYMFRYH